MIHSLPLKELRVFLDRIIPDNYTPTICLVYDFVRVDFIDSSEEDKR